MDKFQRLFRKLHAKRGEFIHHIELNSYENDVGADYVEVIDGDLVLCTPPEIVQGCEQIFKLRWRRALVVEAAV